MSKNKSKSNNNSGSGSGSSTGSTVTGICSNRLLKYCQRVRKITIVRVLYPLPSPKKSLVARSGRSIFLAAGKQTSISAAC